jgi:hypothetical protein
MIRAAYVPDAAGWMLLTTGELFLGIEVSDGSPLLAELWGLLELPTDAGAALDVLTRAGISSAPSFVIVSLGTDAKVLVRGSATVTVEGAEHEIVTGAGFSSWAERSFTRVDRFTCEIAAAAIARDATQLPLVSGAARAGWFGGDAAGLAVFADSELSGEAPLVDSTQVVPPIHPAPVVNEAVAQASVAEATVVAVDEGDEEPVVVAAAEEAVVAPSPYDHLFGETAYRTVEDAAVRPVEEDETPAPPGLEDRTVVASDLAELRAKRRASRGRAAAPPTPVAAFYVELSTGGREVLDQTLVIGRAPAATALGRGGIPRLVTMTTPNQDISRTHAQISVEGGAVVVTDLNSRNGTIVILPGRAAQKLREGEATVVIPGTVVDLGDGATLTVREA